jgi:hypothetical protein
MTLLLCILFQSKLCSCHSGKLKDLTKISVFLMVLYKNRKISSTSAVIKMILVRETGGSSLQCHMAKVIVVGLGEQLKG